MNSDPYKTEQWCAALNMAYWRGRREKAAEQAAKETH